MEYINKTRQGMGKGKTFITQNINKLIENNSYTGKIIKTIIIVILVLVFVKLSKTIYFKYKNWIGSTPWILKGTKSAKKRMIVLQDPSKHNSIELKRSKNEHDGVEFSYVFWMFIDDWTYRQGEWKHVMHKGTSSGSPLRAPGIWLHPNDNKLRVYMNSFENIEEYADVDNIPINKWFNIAVCLKERNLDIFFNGNLVKRHELSSLPKQNYGDLYVNAFKGFSGYLSNIRYYNYYVGYSDLVKQLNKGPSKMTVATSEEKPPYLNKDWWIDN